MATTADTTAGAADPATGLGRAPAPAAGTGALRAGVTPLPAVSPRRRGGTGVARPRAKTLRSSDLSTVDASWTSGPLASLSRSRGGSPKQHDRYPPLPAASTAPEHWRSMTCIPRCRYRRNGLVHSSQIDGMLEFGRGDSDEDKLRAIEYFAPRGKDVFIKARARPHAYTAWAAATAALNGEGIRLRAPFRLDMSRRLHAVRPSLAAWDASPDSVTHPGATRCSQRAPCTRTAGSSRVPEPLFPYCRRRCSRCARRGSRCG